MSLRPTLSPTLSALRALPRTVRAASTSTSSSSSGAASSTPGSRQNESESKGPNPNSSREAGRKYLWLSLLPIAGYYLWPESRKPLNPQVYSEQRVGSNERITPRHVLLTVPVSEADAPQFKEAAVSQAGAPVNEDIVVVQHVMARNPALMVERPYTPINDTREDGEMQLVVKRVRGGEVGRLIHSLKPGDTLGLRGPITTFALNPNAFDTIVMVSTGTAVAPFLQLLAKVPTSAGTRFRLLQQQPVAGEDWSADLIEPLQKKWGDRLTVDRIAPGSVARQDVGKSLQNAGRVLVMVCLPPNLMRPLCGTLTPTLEQGPLTGLLADMGLKSHQVWKLE